MNYEIEEVRDLEEAWPDLERLILGLIDYVRPWDSRVLLPDWASRMRQYMAVSHEALMLLARDESGEAVGFLSGRVSRDQSIFAGGLAHLDNVYLVPEARARGLGTALVRRFEEWACTEGAAEVRLNVNAGNQSGIGFWQHSGFETAEHSMHKALGGAPP